MFQFKPERRREAVGDVIEALDGLVATSWTTASWLTSSHPDLGQRTPLTAINERDADEVRRLARQWAAYLEQD